MLRTTPALPSIKKHTQVMESTTPIPPCFEKYYSSTILCDNIVHQTTVFYKVQGHIVDGLKIRRSPVEVGSLSVYPLIHEDLYIPGGAGFQPATVVDFWWKHTYSKLSICTPPPKKKTGEIMAL